METKQKVLLPASVTPTKYTLSLDVDLENFKFDGTEFVDCTISEATNTVTLHSKEIYIKTAHFTPAGGNKVEATTINFNLKLTTVTIGFPDALPIGNGSLEIEYVGELNNQMAGFYRSNYTSIDGEQRVMASTQFEALDARRCFPCWDEPAIKATFDLTLIVRADRHAFSNMPEEECRLLKDNKKLIHFAESPKMSTYLLAMCVGEFDFVQSVTKNGVSVRVYTPPGKADQGKFSLRVACDTLDLYNDFFEIHYPLPKLDMVAIPEFAMGAMENWGLVTYREVDLLIDEKKASSTQKQRVCTVVTHELAHQWFGNLVTMKWWDDLWLNEGFAAWMQTYAADQLFPEWKMWEQFSIDDQAAALRLDSLRTSHPIQVPIGHAEEVEEVFDAISYCKGACVVRMLYAILGHDDFRLGLQNYMREFSYGNTETIDLWTAWEKVSGKPIPAIMSSWTEQMGFPLLTVESETRTNGQASLTLSQKWFLADGSELAGGDADKKWAIPVIMGTKDQTSTPVEMMSDKTLTVTVPCSADGWVKLNMGQTSLMRVLYPPSLLSSLAEAVRSKQLDPQDRAALLTDSLSIAKARGMKLVDVAKLLECFGNEDSYTAWSGVEMVIASFSEMVGSQGVELESAFAEFVVRLVTPAFTKIGWDERETDGHLDKMLRATLVRLLTKFASADDQCVVGEARARFQAVVDHQPDAHALLPAEFKTPVFKLVLKTGTEVEYDALLKLYGELEDNAEKKHVMHALGYASTAALKLRTMTWTLNEVKLQDFFYPMLGVSASNKQGLDIAWKFYQDNFDAIKSKLAKASPSLMDAVILYCTRGYCTHEAATEIEDFFKSHPLPQSQRKLSQLLEKIRISAEFNKSCFAGSELASPEFWNSLCV